MRFLRGYFYFNLVRYFGGVLLLNGVPAAADANNPALQTRASIADTLGKPFFASAAADNATTTSSIFNPIIFWLMPIKNNAIFR